MNHVMSVDDQGVASDEYKGAMERYEHDITDFVMLDGEEEKSSPRKSEA